jgi:hypothetical protein
VGLAGILPADENFPTNREACAPIRHESRTEDNQDSKDHFCGPLNKRNDTKISCILSCFFRVFRGQTFGCG